MMMAQSALDAYQLGQNDLRGTARFMSMGGAFTALGGDLSSIHLNPAGIGVYRSSEVGATLDINIQSAKSETPGVSMSRDQTKVNCNNFGYVGSISLGSGSTMPFFNWGASYSRVASFDRAYSGDFNSLPTSLTNYVAANTTLAGGWTPSVLDGYTPGYNPYQQSAAPWMSILMYNAYGINPLAPHNSNCDAYQGLFGDATQGIGAFDVVEKGYVDEYAISFGGNVLNTVYWGVGFGITDISYTSQTYWGESMKNALVPNPAADGVEPGDASLALQSYKHIWGTGFNFKAGVIVRPINELRIGLAIHTPTWYNLSYQGYAQAGYNYPTTGYNQTWIDTDEGYLDEFDWKYRSPWRLTVGAAGVIGGKGIISLDYEYRACQAMNVKDRHGNTYNNIDEDIDNYYRASNIVRLGGEYRLTDNWSVRAGYAYESSPVTDGASSGDQIVYTDGPDLTETQPSYSFDRTTQHISCGVGFHYKNFYADAAYVHKIRKSTYHAFDTFDVNYLEDQSVPAAYAATPIADITNHNNSIVLSVGFRF
jgi:hypothetical protein